ncbi:MAG TPA: DUF835 domain-containing protein [Thermoplasmata archaeon]|nr:DUF835 domain-containing protein [Thermoplasmata archaeon]
MASLGDYYSALSLATSALALGVALLVLRRHPAQRAGRIFVAAMSCFLVAAMFILFVRRGYAERWDPGVHIWFARAFYFVHMLAVGMTAGFVGTYFYGFQIFRRRSVLMVLWAVLFGSAILVSSLVTTTSTPYGVFVNSTWSTRTLFAISLFWGLTMVATIGRTLWRNRDPIVRRQAEVMLIGILVHGVGAGTYGYLRLIGELPPPFLSVTALVMAIGFAVAVLRFHVFEVSPRPEEPIPVPQKFELRAGRAYLAQERTPEVAFRALAEATRRGADGLVVTRSPPASVREDYDLEATPILWLTTTTGQNHVPPTEPGLLQRLVSDFARRAARPVVALEGIEYLSLYGGFDEVIRTLHAVRDAVTARGGVLLLSVNPTALEERDVSLLEREFEALKSRPEPAVEDVFVIHKSGLLVAHAAQRLRPGSDHDILVSMLTAIMNFVKISFAEDAYELRRMELEDKTVLIEQGGALILAVVFRGREPEDMGAEMRAFLWRADRRFGPLLERWNGDTDSVVGIRAMTGRLFL